MIQIRSLVLFRKTHSFIRRMTMMGSTISRWNQNRRQVQEITSYTCMLNLSMIKKRVRLKMFFKAIPKISMMFLPMLFKLLNPSMTLIHSGSRFVRMRLTTLIQAWMVSYLLMLVVTKEAVQQSKDLRVSRSKWWSKWRSCRLYHILLILLRKIKSGS